MFLGGHGRLLLSRPPTTNSNPNTHHNMPRRCFHIQLTGGTARHQRLLQLVDAAELNSSFFLVPGLNDKQVSLAS